MRARCLLLAGVFFSSSAVLAHGEAPGERVLRIGTVGAGAGMDVEVLRAFGRTQGLAADVLELDSLDQAVAGLQDGRLHVVAGMAITSTLQRSVDFTVEVLPSRLVVVNRKPADPVTFIEALRGTRLGIVTGSPASEILVAVKLPSWNQVPAASLGAALGDLKAGRTGAAILNIEEALRSLPVDDALQAGVFLRPRQTLAYAVRKGNTTLLGALNTHLGQLRMSPSWSSLLARQAPGLLEALSRARLDDGRPVR
jgi:ABC-type amino acid transport substrate-binding protein